MRSGGGLFWNKCRSVSVNRKAVPASDYFVYPLMHTESVASPPASRGFPVERIDFYAADVA